MDRLEHLTRLPRRDLAVTSAAAGLALGVLIWCVRDYQAFLALGPGGAPYNVKGWSWTVGLRPFALSKRGAKNGSDYPDHGAHDEIKQLPARKGDRAAVGGIIPHRQLSQHAPADMKQHITALFKDAVAQNGDIVHEKLSLYEKHNPAIFVNDDLLSSTTAAKTAQIARGEIGHIHPDFSVHLYIDPSDARLIIEKGWGEKHRLSKPKNSLFKFEHYGLADTYLMIYGPRNEDELDVLQKILKSSIQFMTGREDVKTPQWRES